MPKEVKELEDSNIFLRGKILEFLKKNFKYAYTLKELHSSFLDLDKKSEKKYQQNPVILYHLIYGYLREFRLKNQVIKKGNYYYYKK